MCWTIRLRPQRREDAPGGAPEPPPPFQGIVCRGQYPEFELVYGAECACGILGEGTSAEGAEHFLAGFLAQPGVAGVEVVWFWDDGAGAPALGAEALALRDFARRNEERRLCPNVVYRVAGNGDSRGT